MHPLSTFPQLLTFGLVAPLLLRLMCAIFLALLAKEKYRKSNLLVAILLSVVSVLLILGLYTQVAALIAFAFLKFDFWTEKKKNLLAKDKVLLYVAIEIILLSLVFSGPGFFAFDLPL